MNTQASTEYRALVCYDHVPVGMKLFPVADARHDPHLKPGEWAVIDPRDQEIQWGDLYLVRGMTADLIWQIRKPYGIWAENKGRPTAMLLPLNLPTIKPDGQIDWSKPVHMADGPIYLDCLETRIIGRVVGIYQAVQPALRSAA